jgi:phosphomannomutase/phosphoglucomutase
MSAETLYQCPGEAHPIERPVHLARLANFYSACAACPHRTDTATLSPKRVRMLDTIAVQSRPAASLFTSEGVSGVYLNEVDADVVRRIGIAFGQFLQSFPPHVTGDGRPASETAVVLAHDGRAWTAELSAAAATGLRRAGCRVVDIGAATTPLLVYSQLHISAAGAMMIGNPSGASRQVGLSMWADGGQPCLASGSLDEIERLFHSPALPRHSFGAAERTTFSDEYLADLKDFYHALRPLRVVIACGSAPLHEYLHRLTSSVAVQFLPSPGMTALDSQVELAGAHFGVWIDGDGKNLSLFDERGLPVPLDSLHAAFAREQLESDCAPLPCPDALRTLTLLFVLLSRSDRPLSAWINAAILS